MIIVYVFWAFFVGGLALIGIGNGILDKITKEREEDMKDVEIMYEEYEEL